MKTLRFLCQFLLIVGVVVPAQLVFAYTISGIVKTETGAVLPGVTVVLNGPISKATTTNDLGKYSFTEISNGYYTVAPSKLDYFFTPTIKNVTINGANSTGKNFTGTATSQVICVEGTSSHGTFSSSVKFVRLTENI